MGGAIQTPPPCLYLTHRTVRQEKQCLHQAVWEGLKMSDMSPPPPDRRLILKAQKVTNNIVVFRGGMLVK